MLYQSQNPYNVLSEIISFDNLQSMSEMITLKTLRGRYSLARYSLEKLYVGFVKDLNRYNNPSHVFSDAYDLVQIAVCFLCEFVGKSLDDIYTVKNGKVITIRKAAYTLVGRHIDRIRRNLNRSRDIDYYAEELAVDIDFYKEKDYSLVDSVIERMGLTPMEQEVLDCYMAGMSCVEIANFLGIDRTNVWRRRMRVQAKYNALFNLV